MNDRGKKGAARQLWQQVEKQYRMSNRGSFTTRRSHYNKMSGFIDFVGERFKVQKLENLKDKHVQAYIEWAFREGKSASTVWNTVSAVQYFVNQLPGEKRLSETKNIKEAFIEKQQHNENFQKHDVQRHYIGTGKNPAWNAHEVEKAIDMAEKAGRHDVALAIQFGVELGLRIHEVTRQSRAAVKDSLDKGILTTKGKGGLVRDISVHTVDGRRALQEALRETSYEKQKVFVDQKGETHKAIKSIQNWIYNNRSKFADDPDKKLTFHGLRHSYAQREYEFYRQKTGDERTALLMVAEQMGHGREWITNIYRSS